MKNAAEVLQEWESKEQEILQAIASGVAHPGLARPDQVIGKSGMEIFHAMQSGEIPFAPIAKTLNFFLVEAEHGRAVFQGRPALEHYNPLGSVHGGWFATLLDSALGCAVHTCLPAGKSYTTLELKVNMIRALSDKVPLVRAEGKVIHVGGQVATAEARLYGADDKLFAHATTTCLVFDFPPKR
jgi:uncharacterized protein (TIGR00369 family)